MNNSKATKSLTKVQANASKVWVRYDRNVQLEADGWYISYNGDTRNTPLKLMWGDEPKETALVNKTVGKYYILNGDWRKEYEAIFDKGFDACMQFYIKHMKQHGSSWSDELPRKRLSQQRASDSDVSQRYSEDAL